MNDYLVDEIYKLLACIGRSAVYLMFRYGPSLLQVSGSHVYNESVASQT